MTDSIAIKVPETRELALDQESELRKQIDRTRSID